MLLYGDYPMMSNNGLISIIKGAGVILSGKVLARGLGFIGQILIIRSLSPAQFGEISLAFTVATMASTLLLLGIPEGITRLISANEEQAAEYITGGLLLSSLAGIVGAIIIYLLRQKIAFLMDKPVLMNLVGVFLIYVIVRPFANSSIGVLRGFQMYKPIILSQKLLPKIISITLFLGASIIGFEYWGAIIYWAGAPLFVSLFSSYYIYKKTSFSSIEYDEIKNCTKNLVLFSWPLALQTGFVLLMSHLDILMIGYFSSSSDVGLYRSVQPLAVIALLLLTSIVFVYLPVATQYYTKNNFKALKIIYSISTKWVVHFSLPVIVILVFFSDDVITIFYGTSYTPAALPLSVLAISAFLRIFVGPNGATIKAINKTRVDLFSSILGVFINGTLNILLIPRYGIIGAAIATTLGFLSFNSAELIVIYIETGINPIISETILPVAATTVLSGLLSYSLPGGRLGLIPLLVVGISVSLLHLGSIYFLRGFQQEDIFLVEAIEEEIGSSLITEQIRNVIDSQINE